MRTVCVDVGKRGKQCVQLIDAIQHFARFGIPDGASGLVQSLDADLIQHGGPLGIVRELAAERVGGGWVAFDRTKTIGQPHQLVGRPIFDDAVVLQATADRPSLGLGRAIVRAHLGQRVRHDQPARLLPVEQRGQSQVIRVQRGARPTLQRGASQQAIEHGLPFDVQGRTAGREGPHRVDGFGIGTAQQRKLVAASTNCSA